MRSVSVQAEELKQIVCDLFLGGDTSFPIEPETDLLEAGVCDSLGLAQLAQELEQRVAGLRILDPDITPENLGSIQRVQDYLGSRA